MQMWNSVKSGKSSDYAEILRQIDPTKLPECKNINVRTKIISPLIQGLTPMSLLW